MRDHLLCSGRARTNPERPFSRGTLKPYGAGRPTEYDAENVARAVETYIAHCKEQYWLPTIEGLAVELEVGRKTLYRWAEAHGEFRHTLDVLLALQGSMLIQNGLKGEYNSTITKLMLCSNHHYRENYGTDVTSGGKPVTGFNFISNGGTDPANTANV